MQKDNFSIGSIVLKNILNCFNFIVLLLSVLCIVTEAYYGLFVFVVMDLNVVLSIYLDIKTKGVSTQLQSRKATIKSQNSEVLQENNYILRCNDRVDVDSVIRSGRVMVNEYQVNGVNDVVYKNPGDTVYKDSVILGGEATVEYLKRNYIDRFVSDSKRIKRRTPFLENVVNGIFLCSSIVAFVLLAALIVFGVLTNRITDFSSFKTYTAPLLTGSILILPTFFVLIKTISGFITLRNLKTTDVVVNNPRAIEAVSKINVMCFDKSGVLTDGSYELEEIVPLDGETETFIKSTLFHVLNATKDSDPISIALSNVATSTNTNKPLAKISFSEGNNFSAVTFSDGTYIIGEPQYLNLENKSAIIRQAQDFQTKGYKVYVVSKGNWKINEKTYKNPSKTISFLLLKEKIKEDAFEIIKQLSKENVDIKIISGDNALLVSHIAKKLEIDHADAFVSLKGFDDEAVKEAVQRFVVFGDASPEQKQLIISSLQSSGQKIGVIADGDNDVLMVAQADVSLSMANGGEETKNASDVVINGNKLSPLLELRKEGERQINNFEKITTLFISKAFFGFLASLFFTFVFILTSETVPFPYNVNQILIAEIISTGVSALLLTFGKYEKRPNDKYRRNVLHIAIPGALLEILGVMFIYGMYLYGKTNAVYTGFNSIELANYISIIYLSIFPLFIYSKLALPLKSRRFIYCLLTILVEGICFIGLYFLAKVGYRNNFVGIDFTILSGQNYFVGLMVLFASVTLLFIITAVYELIKGDYSLEEENEN